MPPSSLLRNAAQSKELQSIALLHHSEIQKSVNSRNNLDEELQRLTDDFPLPPSSSPSFASINDAMADVHVATPTALRLPRAAANSSASEVSQRDSAHSRSSTASSAQLRFSLIQTHSSTVAVEGDVPLASPLPRSPPPRLHISIQNSGHDVQYGSDGSPLTPRTMHRRFQSHDDRCRVGGDMPRRMTDPAITPTSSSFGTPTTDDSSIQMPSPPQHPVMAPSALSHKSSYQNMAIGLRASLSAVGQNSLPCAPAPPLSISSSAMANPKTDGVKMLAPANLQVNVRNTFGEQPGSNQSLVMMADSLATCDDLHKSRLSVYNHDDERGTETNSHVADTALHAIASTDENDTDGGMDRRRRQLRPSIPQEPVPSQGLLNVANDNHCLNHNVVDVDVVTVRLISAVLDQLAMLMLEIRQENFNEIQADIHTLTKQEMRAAQALRLAEDEVAYSPDQEAQMQLKRAKLAHERLHRVLTNLLCDREAQSRCIDQLNDKIRQQEQEAGLLSPGPATADESESKDRYNSASTASEDDEGDKESGFESETTEDMAAPLSPSALNIDERITQLERSLRVQREEAEEREEMLEMQLRNSHEHWRSVEQRLRTEQTAATTKLDRLQTRLNDDAERQNEVLQHSEALAEPWQLELPDGHRIYVAAASSPSSPQQSDDEMDSDSETAKDGDSNATEVSNSMRRRRQRQILRALDRARWQRDHLAEHLETYAHELRIQRERNEKLVRVVLEQVRKKLMDEELTGDLDNAMSLFSERLDATLNLNTLGIPMGGAGSVSAGSVGMHRRRGSNSSVSTSNSYRSLPTPGYFDDMIGASTPTATTRRVRPRLLGSPSSNNGGLLRSPNPRLNRDLSELSSLRRTGAAGVDLALPSDSHQSQLSWASSADTLISEMAGSPLGSVLSALSGTTTERLPSSTDLDMNGCYSGQSTPSMARSRSYNSDLDVKARRSAPSDINDDGKLDMSLLSPSSVVSATASMVEHELRERSATLTELDALRMQLRQQQRNASEASNSPSPPPASQLASTAANLGHRVTASETDAVLADQIKSGMSDTDGETRRMSMLVSPTMSTTSEVSPSAIRLHRLRNVHTSDDLRASTKLWTEAARRRGNDPVIAESLERLTRLRAEITILEKTVLQSNRSLTHTPSSKHSDDNDSGRNPRHSISEPNSAMQNKMSLVLTRKRKEYMTKMRALSELCGQPLTNET
ncbi:hypothetical protein BDF19DRAFT_416882 [Syncephalis fuscata]|nr:hypothetical protein BDF19DRAFT_416882 [Syncephalis fuscata]